MDDLVNIEDQSFDSAKRVETDSSYQNSEILEVSIISNDSDKGIYLL